MPIIPSSGIDWRDRLEPGGARSTRDARHQARRACHVPARFWVEGDSAERSAVVRNLSEIGAFLETDPLPIGTLLRLSIKEGTRTETRCCEVVWREDLGPSARCRPLHGMGVRFLTR